MRIKDFRDEEVSLPVGEFARLLAIAADYTKVAEKLKLTEAKIQRMREQLTAYQRICERLKSSDAGASGEPHTNATNANEPKADAVLVTNEAEGRVSGGDRATYHEDEKPLPCPFCGDKNLIECNRISFNYECHTCGYASGLERTKEEAIAAHNRVAKKCKEVK